MKIFPNRGFRRSLWFMQILNMLVVLSYVILCFAQCQPFPHFWNGWDGAHEGHCVDLNRIGLSHVSLNITLDVIILILPITQIYKLQLNRKKKIGVMANVLGRCLRLAAAEDSAVQGDSAIDDAGIQY
ncbi:integral membrane protein [Colletotrichum salicis]|uniref:Integral membrane protein n=1 Tax=Colletotrichum salicis TaxID=1209931 RepID=A0A135T5I9_9PEZI|nr:integral membrane protein [Colletotrichum salicis]